VRLELRHRRRNYARYCNKEVDALWEKGMAELDAGKRKEIFDQVTLKLAEDPPQATFTRTSSSTSGTSASGAPTLSVPPAHPPRLRARLDPEVMRLPYNHGRRSWERGRLARASPA